MGQNDGVDDPELLPCGRETRPRFAKSWPGYHPAMMRLALLHVSTRAVAEEAGLGYPRHGMGTRSADDVQSFVSYGRAMPVTTDSSRASLRRTRPITSICHSSIGLSRSHRR
jgi:hypothetical protein